VTSDFSHYPAIPHFLQIFPAIPHIANTVNTAYHMEFKSHYHNFIFIFPQQKTFNSANPNVFLSEILGGIDASLID